MTRVTVNSNLRNDEVSKKISTSNSTISLDFIGNYRSVIFTGLLAITSSKIWNLVNDSCAQRFTFIFNMSGLYAQTMPSNFRMNNYVGEWDSTSKTWTPIDTGIYTANAIYDSVNAIWGLDITGPK